MNYPFFLAKRLSLSSGKKKNAPAVTVAVISIALAVAVMLASIAVVLGFKEEIREKVVGFNGHISLFSVPLSEEEDNLLTLDSSLKSVLDSIDYITDYSVQASIPAVLKTETDFKGIYLKKLSGESPERYVAKNLEEGTLPDFFEEDNKNKIVISRIAAKELNLKTGDKIDTYFITDDIRVRRLEIAGIYNSHFDQYDDVLIFGSPSLVNSLGNLEENQGTYLLISTDNFDKIEEYNYDLVQKLNSAYANGKTHRIYRTDTVLSQGRGFFSWLSLLDTNVVVIIILMLIVGTVTLVSGMLIIILQRKKFIGLMRAIGAPISKIRKVFIFLAVKIAFIGLLIGNLVMLTLLFLQEKYHFLHLDADSYYIDFVPIKIPVIAIVILNLGVLAITYLILVVPSRFVAKISPSETMRYE